MAQSAKSKIAETTSLAEPETEAPDVTAPPEAAAPDRAGLHEAFRVLAFREFARHEQAKEDAEKERQREAREQSANSLLTLIINALYRPASGDILNFLLNEDRGPEDVEFDEDGNPRLSLFGVVFTTATFQRYPQPRKGLVILIDCDQAGCHNTPYTSREIGSLADVGAALAEDRGTHSCETPWEDD